MENASLRKSQNFLLRREIWKKLKIAVHYGADAVFIGGREYGLRSNADNFSIEEMAEGVEFAKNTAPEFM